MIYYPSYVTAKVLAMTYKALCHQPIFYTQPCPVISLTSFYIILSFTHCMAILQEDQSFSCSPLSQRCILQCTLLWDILLLISFLPVESELCSIFPQICQNKCSHLLQPTSTSPGSSFFFIFSLVITSFLIGYSVLLRRFFQYTILGNFN